MDDNQKFLICTHCSNLIGCIEDKGVPMMCCGENMKALVPNTVEASIDKHLPVVKKDASACNCGCTGLRVQVGSPPHPMLDKHHISFVYVETARGGQRKRLQAGDEAVLSFSLTDDEPPVAVYAYCNLHGLWKTSI